jgi:pimeloyl-ACP methyl ester carboxylesterase
MNKVRECEGPLCLLRSNRQLPLGRDQPTACCDSGGSPSELPTIVLEAGGGGSTGECWAFVQEGLAQRGRVVSYDRAGFRRNTEFVDDLGAPGVTARLKALLTRAAIPPPYVLVGHSLGGLFVQHYAITYPEDIAGLVLMDPTNSGVLSKAAREYNGRAYRAMSHHRRFVIVPLQVLRIRLQSWGLRALAWSRLLRLWNPFSSFTRELAALRPTQILLGRHPVLPDVATLVISSGKLLAAQSDDRTLPSYHAHFLAALLQHDKDVAARSQRGRHVLMAEADHNSLLEDREHATKVVELILDFAETCRKSRGAAAD